MQINKGKSVNKQSAGPLNTGDDRHKVRRVSAGQGMVIVANSVEIAIDSLKDIVTGNGKTESTPQLEGTLSSESRAIKAIENDEGFSDEELKDAILVIENNPKHAEMYLSLERKGARTSYLRHHMKELKKYN